MRLFRVLCGLIASLWLPCSLAKEVLVLLGEKGMAETHSVFLADLKASRLELDVRDITDRSLRLQNWGQWLYDGVIVLAGKGAEFGGAVDPAYLIDFVDAGRSLLVATDATASAPLRHLTTELGADLLSPGHVVLDHVAHASDSDAGAVLATTLPLPAVTGDTSGPVLFRGTGLTVAPSALRTTPVLVPPATAIESGGGMTGPQLAFATAMATRDNARFVAIASLEALSDAAFSAKVAVIGGGAAVATGNRVFAREAALWAMQERGMLQLSNFSHRRVGESGPPPLRTYTVNDTIEVGLDLHEWRGGAWLPHVTNRLQAEFVMLDPHVRKTLRHTGDGHYEATVHAPDVYGAFKWVVDYKAPGFSPVLLSEVTPLRPLRHSEYPRFIVQAYPYYVALVSLSVAFLITVRLVVYYE